METTKIENTQQPKKQKSTLSRFLRKYPWTVPLWIILFLYVIGAVYAPLFAAGHPLWVKYQGHSYFPLFRYLFYTESYSKPIDLFFNLLMFTLPILTFQSFFKAHRRYIPITLFLHILVFIFLSLGFVKNPETVQSREKETQERWDWQNELSRLNDYAKLNLLWDAQRRDMIDQQLRPFLPKDSLSPYMIQQKHREEKLQQTQDKQYQSYLQERHKWIENERKKLDIKSLPLWRWWYWEENTGGDQSLNPYLPWDQRCRLNRKDLSTALLFGARISLVVGLLAVSVALIIGIPIGAISGYYGGKWDMMIMRWIEIWESFPSFFMLLFITAMMQSKSIFLVIIILGIFSWTSFARFIRAEVLKQKVLPYADACLAMGLSQHHILFKQILPNCMAPILTLLPFAVMGAISAEAGLSFLGLGEEGSCSWGTLMDEGRMSFPAESYLLWPPAIVLTILLVTIAILGDSLRDWMDPRLKT